MSMPRCVTSAFLGGRLALNQPANGHRSGTDAILLAAAAPADFCGLAIDAGAGAGAAGLALAATHSQARVGLLENDALMVALALANCVENRLDERCFVLKADLLSPASRRDAGLTDETARLVITNPPFLDPGRARLSPEPRKRHAHAMQAQGPEALTAWIRACLALVEPGGELILIHRPDALSNILEAMAGRAGGATVLPIHPRAASKAVRILVRGKKGSRGPLAIAAPLVLHEGERFTPFAEAINCGRAAIVW